MRNKKRVLIKYMALMLILVSALLLSACRTRITNNNEVTNVYNDEDGFLSETYEMRRSELGLSTAKKPLLPDFGSDDDEEEDFDTGETINYEEEEEEPYVEPPETQNDSNNSNTNTNSGTSGTRTRTTTPRSSTRRSTSTSKYTVTFYGNGGTPKEQNKQFSSGDKLAFPKTTPSKEGYEFDGWWTSKENGSQVKKGDKVRSNKKLYAHWKKKENSGGGGNNQPATPTSPHTITLKYDDDGATSDGSITVTEDGKYSGLPENVTSRGIGYEFEGWYDENGNRIKNGDKVGKTPPKTLTAKWGYYPDKYWDNEFNVASNTIDPDDKRICVIEGQSEGRKKLIEACKGDVTSDKSTAQVVIKFIEGLNEDKASTEAANIRNSGEYPDDITVVLIDTDAVETDNKNQKILYKMLIFESLYGTDYWSDGNSISRAKGKNELDTDGVTPIKK